MCFLRRGKWHQYARIYLLEKVIGHDNQRAGFWSSLPSVEGTNSDMGAGRSMSLSILHDAALLFWYGKGGGLCAAESLRDYDEYIASMAMKVLRNG